MENRIISNIDFDAGKRTITFSGNYVPISKAEIEVMKDIFEYAAEKIKETDLFLEIANFYMNKEVIME